VPCDSQSPWESTIFRLAFGAAVLAAIAPLLATRYLPFTDLPEHVAAMATIARYGDFASGEAATYELAFGTSPYLVYHCLGALLTKVTGDAVEANRLLLVVVAIAYPTSLAAALRALGRDVRLAVFGCMPLLGRALFVGFLPYLASVPLHFVGIALVATRARRPRAWHDGALAALAVALFYSHLSALVVFIATAVVLDVVLSLQMSSAASPRAWARSGKITMRAESVADPTEIGRMSSFRALYTLPLWAFDIFHSHLDEACAVGFWLALIALAILGLRAAAREPPHLSLGEAGPSRAGWPRALRLVARLDACYVPLLCAGIVYVAMPFRVGAGMMLNVRLAPVVILTSILSVRGPRGRATTIICAAAAIVTMVHSANAVVHIRKIAARYTDGFDGVLAAIRPGSKVVTLSFDAQRHETRFPPYAFAGAYHRARSGGIASYSFTEMHHWSVHYRESARPPTKGVPLWIYAPCEYRNKIDGMFYDYVLVIGEVDPFAKHPAGPRFRSIRRTAAMALYEKVEPELNAVDGASDAPCGSITMPCCTGEKSQAGGASMP